MNDQSLLRTLLLFFTHTSAINMLFVRYYQRVGAQVLIDLEVSFLHGIQKFISFLG